MGIEPALAGYQWPVEINSAFERMDSSAPGIGATHLRRQLPKRDGVKA
jgi:hypothetical protein